MNPKEKTRIIKILQSMSSACAKEKEFSAAYCLDTVANAMMDDSTHELGKCIHDGYDKPQTTATLATAPIPEELEAAQDVLHGSV